MAMAFDIQMNQSTLAGSSTNNNNHNSVLGHVVSFQHICDFMRGVGWATGRQDGMVPVFPSLPPTSSGNYTSASQEVRPRLDKNGAYPWIRDVKLDGLLAP